MRDVDRDRMAIEGLVSAYATRLDAGDLDGVASLFARASFGAATRGVPCRGATAVRRVLDGVILYEDGTPGTRHGCTNLVVSIAADRRSATSRCYVVVWQSRPGFPLQPVLAGRYVDRFVRDDEGWRFDARVVHPDLIGDLRHHMRAAPLRAAPEDPS